MKHLPSASELQRALACPSSHLLPSAALPASDDATWGTAVHRYVEVARMVGRDRALAEIPPENEHRAKLARLDLEGIPAGAESEVALGYSPQGQVIMGAKMDLDRVTLEPQAIRYDLTEHRAYPEDGLWHATLDLVGTVGDEVWIVDLKTGNPTVAAQDSAQLQLQALAATTLTGKDSARVAFWYLRDERWWRDEATFDVWTLSAFAEDLVALERRLRDLEALPIDELPVVTGDHCRYCPAILRCPAHTAHLRAFSAEAETLEARLAAMTPAQLGEAWPKLKQLEKLLEAILKGYGTMRETLGPLPLPGGQVLDWRSTGNTTKIKPEAAAWVLEHWGPKVLAETSAPQAKLLSEAQFKDLETAGLVDVVPKAPYLAPKGTKRKLPMGKENA